MNNRRIAASLLKIAEDLMTVKKFAAKGPWNLDAMDADELMEFYHKNKDENGTMLSLAMYAKDKAKAMELREQGNIAEAMKLEKKCDDLYDRLPVKARW